ncbi:MAG: glycerol-3-phosphate dehydrogenase/oxidase [Myxococcota bacterium]|nr:glycerol-3-phosphate dehydrogenase/oxidase [Myxococcota bacterium]MDW8362865.1 glycerol-3-phosphate dehydrogenase/oxidase [Myxococcales bacterium]
MPTRRDMWERLPGTADLVVVGGGIVGCGVAREAARRGLRTVLFEKDDLGYGTSSRSSKLVHGGLRYLEQLRVGLVFESVSERHVLRRIAPHLVTPLPFLFPVHRGSRHRLWKLDAGMWLYDGLALFRAPRLHRTLTPEQVSVEEPLVAREGLLGAPLYWDCATDDARLVLETALDAIAAGAVVLTHAPVEALLRDARGRIAGVRARDALSDARREVRASVVVNATGPWTDLTLGLEGARRAARPLLRPTKGIHVVVDHARLPLRHAVVVTHPRDGRVMFAIPWGDRTYAGTTDTDLDEPLDEVAASAADVAYVLEGLRAVFPDARIGEDDVIATWAGVRPLVAPPDGRRVDESSVSREHEILTDSDGLVTVAGGKLTTYRRMAAEVVDAVVGLLLRLEDKRRRLRPSGTDRTPLPGAVGWDAHGGLSGLTTAVEAAAGGRLTRACAESLARTYGVRALDLARACAGEPSLAEPLVPGRPEILAQVDWAVRHELAERLCDVLVRRTQLFARDVDRGLGAATRVCAHMAKLLSWSARRCAQELEHYQAEVARSRRWREDSARAPSRRASASA